MPRLGTRTLTVMLRRTTGQVEKVKITGPNTAALHVATIFKFGLLCQQCGLTEEGLKAAKEQAKRMLNPDIITIPGGPYGAQNDN